MLSALAYPFVDTTTAFSLSQLGVQAAGVVVLGVWAAAITLVVYGGMKAVGWARVEREEEIEGLDSSEHDIQTYPEFGENMVGDVTTRSDTPPAADGGKGVADDD
jgi:Amt family ammonium transporter